ncbi:hypothetical protein [Streptomyces sp. WAC06614]|uniref:hypothetical protein n=1 Tax=Streptomyces sp. WAC06614 TaxID=2487416 RepID=UPI000F7B4491|nr:hypothetical protein [Streptomyces sp. WAC06614]RSS79388.1 hypothetical protein EF918_17590 [Streptomyces sp. WAC06614]
MYTCTVCECLFETGDVHAWEARDFFFCPAECEGVLLCKDCYPGVLEFPCERCGTVLTDPDGNRATPEYADTLPRRCQDCNVPHADRIRLFCRRGLHPVIFCPACLDRYEGEVLCPHCHVALEDGDRTAGAHCGV